MARPEIPSIVVHNGSASAPGSPSMDLSPESPIRPTRSLSKQNSLANEEDIEERGPQESGELSPVPPLSVSSSQASSLPVTPLSPSPTVSPPSPGGSSPGRPRSATPSSCGSNHNSISPSRSVLPQGPGPGYSFESGTMAVGPDGHPVSPSGLGAASRSKSLELQQQKSSDSEKDNCMNNISGRHRQYYHASRLKLLQRSRALQEDSSPPPDALAPSSPGQGYPHGPMNSLTVCQPTLGGFIGAQRRRMRQQGSSSQGSSFEGSSPCLSRDSSMEYTDSTGVDLLPFIIQTLHKNQKDRMLLLKIERELVNMVRDPKRTYHKFPHMSSYQRMLVHRVAAFFGMEHNVDQGGTCVIVNKTRNTRLPESRFREHIREELLPPDEPKRSILRRGYASFEEEPNYKSPDRLHGFESRRSKSFEEREQEYEKSFSIDEVGGDSPRRYYDSFNHYIRRNSHDDSQWQEVRPMPIDVEAHRKHYDNHRIRPFRLHKGESFEHDGLNSRSLRPPVFKSNSFGGYSGGVTVLSRGNSVASNPSSRLSKQDSTGSRFSDHSSSSGYKTQRQDTSSTNMSNTLSTTPSPTAGHFHHQHPSFGQNMGVWGGDGECHPVMWAVTDMEAVPSGALLINPQNGQPYTNMDGTLYRYDPSNPPPMYKSCPPKIMSGTHKESKENHGLQDMKGDSSDIDEGIERASCNSKEAEGSFDKPNVRRCVVEDIPASQTQFVNAGSTIESRPYSEESANDMSGHFRQLSLSGGSGTTVECSDSTSMRTPAHPQGYVVPRGQQYAPAVYYMPAGNVQNLPGGGVKYVYPQYQATAVPGTPGAPPAPSNLPTATLQSQPPAVPPLATLPHTIPGPGASNPQTPIAEPNAHLSTGYIPSNYTLLTYPPNGMLTTPTTVAGGHESGGTTYYCQMTPGLPNMGPGAVPGATTASVPAVTMAQYIPTSTVTTTYPMAMGYYTASGMGSNPLYQNPVGVQGYPGPVYGASTSHPAVGPQPPPPSQGGVSYRASTPPHTTSTQGMSMPLGGYNSAPGTLASPGGVGSQYIAVLPPQPSTPTTQASQMYSAFYRPPLQSHHEIDDFN